MRRPGLTQETVHGNLGLQLFLASSLVYSQNLSTGYIKGNKWYVDGDATAGNDGETWETAFSTITAANAAMSDDDVCYIAPGEYTEVGAVVVTNNNVKFLGVLGGRGPAVVNTMLAPFDGELDTDLNPVTPGSSDGFHLDGNGIEIANLGFQGGAGYWMIDLPGSNDTNPSGTHIHNCYFYAHAQGSAGGVKLGNREAGGYGNAVSAVLEDCFFFKCGPIALNMDGSRQVVQRNKFIVFDNTTAIDNPQSGTQRNTGTIADNRFVAWGTANQQKGINFSGASSPTAGTMLVDGNRFINFGSATLACNKLSTYGGVNYFNHQYLTAANPPVATNRHT